MTWIQAMQYTVSSSRAPVEEILQTERRKAGLSVHNDNGKGPPRRRASDPSSLRVHLFTRYFTGVIPYCCLSLRQREESAPLVLN